jgi:hypothetical protein
MWSISVVSVLRPCVRQTRQKGSSRNTAARRRCHRASLHQRRVWASTAWIARACWTQRPRGTRTPQPGSLQNCNFRSRRQGTASHDISGHTSPSGHRTAAQTTSAHCSSRLAVRSAQTSTRHYSPTTGQLTTRRQSTTGHDTAPHGTSRLAVRPAQPNTPLAIRALQATTSQDTARRQTTPVHARTPHTSRRQVTPLQRTTGHLTPRQIRARRQTTAEHVTSRLAVNSLQPTSPHLSPSDHRTAPHNSTLLAIRPAHDTTLHITTRLAVRPAHPRPPLAVRSNQTTPAHDISCRQGTPLHRNPGQRSTRHQACSARPRSSRTRGCSRSASTFSCPYFRRIAMYCICNRGAV